MSTKRIGEFLVEKKVLSPAEAEQILEYGSREGLRFGEAGIKLGLLSEEDLAQVFGKNYRVDFFHLDPRFYPRITSRLLGLDTILKYGVLPLGVKAESGLFKQGKILNLGLLDPGREDALQAAEREVRAQEEFRGSRVFLILADQFLNVLQSVYGASDREIAQKAPDQLDPTLIMFLEGRV